ncbi:MAG: hypothetical protein ABIS26_00200 [Candidatus Paceibacterota bacterium]
MNSTDNGSVEYRADFAKRAKELYPDEVGFHHYFERGSIQVGSFLKEQRHLDPDKVLELLSSGDLEELKKEVELAIRRYDLYGEYEYGGK